jgi:hypothetical protein
MELKSSYPVAVLFQLLCCAVSVQAGDGIPDSWRLRYFGPNFATDPRAVATADPDGDGTNNYQEFLAGTDPLNPDSVNRVPVSISTFAGSTRGGQDGYLTQATFTAPGTIQVDRYQRL